MAETSGIYCSRKEYDEYIDDRLQADSLLLDGLFTVYFLYRAHAKRDAARCMARILDLRGLQSEPSQVSFSLLDNDLRPFAKGPSSLTLAFHGALLDPSQLSSDGGARENIAQGYFLAYDALTGYDDELRVTTELPILESRKIWV